MPWNLNYSTFFNLFSVIKLKKNMGDQNIRIFIKQGKYYKYRKHWLIYFLFEQTCLTEESHPVFSIGVWTQHVNASFPRVILSSHVKYGLKNLLRHLSLEKYGILKGKMFRNDVLWRLIAAWLLQFVFKWWVGIQTYSSLVTSCVKNGFVVCIQSF